MTMYMVDELDALDEAGEIRLDMEALIYAAYAEHEGFEVEDFEHWSEEAEEAYQGMFRSDEEFAEELYNSIYDLSVLDEVGLTYYIDWDRVAGDLLIDDYFEQDGYYFRRL